MRIIGEVPHPTLKITVFMMNGRVSIKFEKDLMEQTYKYRDGELEGFADAQAKIDESFISHVLLIFDTMDDVRHKAEDNTEEDLPEII